MKAPSEIEARGDFRRLEAEAAARRLRLSENLADLGQRLTFSNLLAEAQEMAWKKVDAMADEAARIAEDLVHDSMDWARQNRSLAVGGAAAAILGGAAWWWASRKQPVPVYEAYAMEDPAMMDDHKETLAERATETWSKVRDEARHLGDRASEGYYAARSKAAGLSDATRERAHVAAERARDGATDARRWAVRQPDDHPVALVVAALAAGALIGALLPGRRRD